MKSGNELLVIPRACFSADRALCATPQEASWKEKWADARDASPKWAVPMAAASGHRHLSGLALAVLVAIGRQPANAAGTAKKRAERLSRSARGSGQRRTAKPYADSHGCRKRLGEICCDMANGENAF
jgi:hypothetical protein